MLWLKLLKLNQWFFNISNRYSAELLNDLEQLQGWPKSEIDPISRSKKLDW